MTSLNAPRRTPSFHPLPVHPLRPSRRFGVCLILILACGAPWLLTGISHPVFAAQAADSATAPPPSSAAGQPGDPLDWPFWRGPRYDGVSLETGLIDDFDPRGGEGSNVLWKREDLGTRSTPIVMNGKLYVLARSNPDTNREGERVVCVDAKTGETLWENHFNVWLSDVPNTRVAWSSVVGDPETGNVYALGVCGLFQCLDGNTGKKIWSVSMHEFFGLLTTFGGRTTFPVICEDLVIASGIITGWGEMAKPAHRLVAFDKRTGEVMWFNGTNESPYDTIYSAPAVTVLNGQRALVFGSGDGEVWAFQPRTGQPIWHYEISRRGLNVSPLVVGDTVYMGHSEENEVGTAMGTVVAIDGSGSGELTQAAEKWRILELMVGKSSPVLYGNQLFCISDAAKLYVLDASTGEMVSQRPAALGRIMRASPLIADGKLYAASANGDWFIFRVGSEAGVEPVSKGRFPRGEEIDASPICSHGCVYFTTSGAIYCLSDPTKTPGSVPPPSVAEERPVADNRQLAHVQVVPAEVLMRPGEQQQFRTRIYNGLGQLLEEKGADYRVRGPGSITPDGTFQADPEAAHQAAYISASVGDVSGVARVRIVPPLPWEFTFEDISEPPIPWVGARHRHVIRNQDGNHVLVKVTTIPKGTRSRCWFGPPDLSDYTIEADVRGGIADGKMPDIGIIAQGYTLDLQGVQQKLQVRTWAAQLRIATTIDFPWKPDTWYTVKLRAENHDGKAMVRGKVWPKGQAEPAEWTVEAEDPSPNVTGSPGLFGNATNAEITMDNLKVSAN